MSYCYACDQFVAKPTIIEHRPYCLRCAKDLGPVPSIGTAAGNVPESGTLTARSGRTFDTGAYRDSDDDKYDFEGFLSPLVLEAYAAYMHRHRVQSDGQVRKSDNWQRGIPRSEYMKSAFRHFMDLWLEHRGHASRDGLDEALGGLLFNVCGYWLETLREREIRS